MKQPTAEEVRIAFSIAIELQDIGGARASARQDLQRIRDRKTTWIGKSENDLRFAVDRFLRGEPCGM